MQANSSVAAQWQVGETRTAVNLSASVCHALQGWRDEFAPDLIGEHETMLALLHDLRRVAEAECDVLVTGASGTGKELVARAIHRGSARASRPFVALNCAAIPKELMESEVFGHARGAFTGAVDRRIGKFESAHGGTLFLDEVGEMELPLQSKLLRVLQERELTPVGSSNVVRLDVRIVAATNQDLLGLCREKLFREDLYYRLNVVPLRLPKLCERRADIPLLVGHFLRRANRRHSRSLGGLDAAAATAMCHYDWPGNVRELHNVIERIAVLKSRDESIRQHDLPSHVARCFGGDAATKSGRTPESPAGAAHHDGQSGFLLPNSTRLGINEMLAQVETQLTLDALQKANGNKKRAAELLGLKRTTLVERLKKLNLNVGSQAVGEAPQAP